MDESFVTRHAQVVINGSIAVKTPGVNHSGRTGGKGRADYQTTDINPRGGIGSEISEKVEQIPAFEVFRVNIAQITPNYTDLFACSRILSAVELYELLSIPKEDIEDAIEPIGEYDLFFRFIHECIVSLRVKELLEDNPGLKVVSPQRAQMKVDVETHTEGGKVEKYATFHLLMDRVPGININEKSAQNHNDTDSYASKLEKTMSWLWAYL